LTESTVGGERGGGTRLTAEGRDIVSKFRVFTRGLKETVEQQFEKAFGGGT
jgi:molybdate transport repressor ModE-like protein